VFARLILPPLPPSRCDEVSGRLFALGAAGLEEQVPAGEEVPVRQPWDDGPAPPEPERVVLVATFEDADRGAVADALSDLGDPRWEDVPDTDWDEVWKRGFTRIVVSDRLVVAPPWDAPDGAVVIEPGVGFGTGLHTTTRQALRAVDALADSHHTLLDVGCGSGILALAGARLGLTALGFDVEEGAVREARRHAERNGLAATFEQASVAAVTGRWDLVVANLHAELLVASAADLLRLTGRTLAVAGVLEDREPAVERALALHLRRIHREVEDGWVASWWTP
jgi:ribosomal protein L11 methyltransferase